MNRVRIFTGSALALGLAGVSVTCCYSFGTHLASGAEGQLYGVLGAIADSFKAVLPMSIAAALASNERGRAFAGVALFGVLSIYSFVSELGLYALSRDAVASGMMAGKAGYEQTVSERDQVRARLKELGAVRTAGTIEADMAAARINRYWKLSEGCTKVDSRTARDLCTGYEQLNAELATAREVQSFRVRETILNQKLDGVDLAQVMKSADPQAEALARFTGVSPSTARDSLAVLVALLIEIGSGFGMWIATAGMVKPDAQPGQKTAETSKVAEKPKTAGKFNRAADPLMAFLAQWTVAQGETAAGELRDAANTWLAANGHDEVSAQGFGKRMSALGIKSVKRGGRQLYPVSFKLRVVQNANR